MNAAKTTAGAISAAGKAYGEAATQAFQAHVNAVQTVAGVAVDAAKVAGKAIVAVNDAGKDAIVEAVTEVKDNVIWTAKYAENYVVASLASGIATVIKKYSWMERCLVDKLAPKGTQVDDGHYMGQDCPKSSETPPVSGTKPKGCAGSGKAFPKIIYTNGINTSAEAACTTMHKIADTRCAEVIGIYNATDGIGGDVVNANRKINGDESDPAAQSLARLVQSMAARGEQINIYAHSEGGLNAQTGLRVAQQRMLVTNGPEYTDKAMQGIHVNSFGTAQLGWPPGPIYRQFTNDSDPVPGLIGAAQRGTRGRSFEDAPNTSRNEFPAPNWNPIDSHSMDNAYLDQLNSLFPVAKNANGSCC